MTTYWSSSAWNQNSSGLDFMAESFHSICGWVKSKFLLFSYLSYIFIVLNDLWKVKEATEQQGWHSDVVTELLTQLDPGLQCCLCGACMFSLTVCFQGNYLIIATLILPNDYISILNYFIAPNHTLPFLANLDEFSAASLVSLHWILYTYLFLIWIN